MILRLLLVVCLLFSAIGFGYLAWQMLTPSQDDHMAALEEVVPAAPPVMAKVLVAAQSLPVATLLKDTDLVVREFSVDAVPDGALIDSDEVRAEIRGAMLRRYLDAGVPIQRGDVLRLRDRGFLAAVLRPGTRAIAIGVDAVTGAAGLIWPGDQVDLILTQEMMDEAGGRRQEVSGETVLTDIRVIAVDQQITQGRSDAEEQRKLAQTVTLEVRPDQAERVAVAARLGSIALTVRPVEVLFAEALAADVQAGGDRPMQIKSRAKAIFGADVSSALSLPPPASVTRMRVIQGDIQQDVVFP